MRPVSGMTAAEIREAAHAAIIRELGVAGLLRYLNDQSLGSGDYARDRAALLPEHPDAASLLAAANQESERLLGTHKPPNS